MMTERRMKVSDRVWARRPLVVLLGPTAVGKSRVAVPMARHLDTEVLAADSRQVYRGMDIGTDKPTAEERQGIPHRLIDLLEPDQPVSTGWYRRKALEEISRLYEMQRLPLIVGGTGLYIRTLIRGLCPAPPADQEIRAELTQLCRALGRDRLYADLVRVDPDTAARLHPNDEAKVIRALEVFRLTGQPLSRVQERHGFEEAAFTPLLIGLHRPREALYRRVEARIDWQLAHGMVEETKGLLDRGYARESGAMKGLGYRQVSAYLAGEYDYAEMVRRFKRDTRHFAKRQMTWFRKEPGIEWTEMEDGASLEHTVQQLVHRIDRFLTSLEEAAESGVPRTSLKD
jgi:tRNA dimethylallyltransferase